MQIYFFPKIDLKLFIFLGIIILIIIFRASQVKSQEQKPLAIIQWLSSYSTPLVSEQILLKKFKDQLIDIFDFRLQSKFELAIHKIKHLSKNGACEELKCTLKVHSGFKKTTLFLFKSTKEHQRLSLLMIGENRKWHIKHEVCQNCGLILDDMVKNLVLRLENYFRENIVLNEKIIKNSPKFVFSSDVDSATNYIDKRKSRKVLEKIDKQSEIKLNLKNKKSPLDKLQFKIAQRQYNQLIWKKIKKELMFFRRKNISYSVKSLKARLQLKIDKFGRVIERSLVDTSGSEKFDKRILDSVDILKLPPPMKNLIISPPYVVTIVIQP